MSDRKNTDHPDLLELAAFAEGSLDSEAAAEVGVHVAGCALCDLELKRLARFDAIDEDDELTGRADWETAVVRLEVPRRSIAASGGEGASMHREKNFLLRWIVPVAAAAVLLVLVMPDFLESPGRYTDQPSPLRGDVQPAAGILLEAPLGELAGPPKYFTWKPDKAFDFYTLRIFTIELEPVYEETGITSRKRVVADSLLAALRPGVIYLWTVTGHTGLEQEAASPTAKFTISENPPQR